MARMRIVKPEFFKNEDLAETGPVGQLLFEGLWILADREGRLEDRPKKIKAEIFPYYEADVEGLLTQLCRMEFITRYEVDGKRYIQVVNFTKHQRPHIKEAASTIPAPGEFGQGDIKDGASTNLGTCEHVLKQEHVTLTNIPPTPQGGKDEVNLLPDPPAAKSRGKRRAPKKDEAPQWLLVLWENNPKKDALPRAITKAWEIEREAPDLIPLLESEWSSYVAGYSERNGSNVTWMKLLCNWLEDKLVSHKLKASITVLTPSKPVEPEPQEAKPWQWLIEQRAGDSDGDNAQEWSMRMMQRFLPCSPGEAFAIFQAGGVEGVMEAIHNHVQARRSQAG